LTTKKTPISPWAGTDSPVVQAVEDGSRKSLEAYGKQEKFVAEHANLERATLESGYGQRQVYELIQNGADELLGEAKGGRIELVLTKEYLYCANEGSPMSPEGAETILFSNVSSKKGIEIGRFGLGFKSVVGISNHPQIFSRSGSFGFDLAANKKRIREVVPSAKQVATLRLASGLDPAVAAKSDPVLKELMKWATTVVRLSRDVADTSWLHQDFNDFPEEFLIFCPQVRELVFDDRQKQERRVLTLEQLKKGQFKLKNDQVEQKWRVSMDVHEPSAAARKAGGYAADRDEVPVYWAVPDGGGGVGQFWAFFPTKERTTLSGVLNAPWQLDPARVALIEGPFNKELLGVAAQLVVEKLPDSVTKDDPGVILEIIPARGRETRGWADETLGNLIYDLACFSPSLPDQNGQLELPGDLTLHPSDIPEAALEAWAEAPGRPVDWCHRTVDSRNRTVRRARVVRLIQEGGGLQSNVKDWLEILIDEDNAVATSKAAIRTAALCMTVADPDLERIQGADIILTAASKFASAADEVFIPSGDGTASSVPLVHPDLAADDDTRKALVILGVPVVSALTLLQEKLKDPALHFHEASWEEVWQLIRGCTSDEVSETFASNELDAGSINVRSVSGAWGRLSTLLLPGGIVSLADATAEDREILIDTDWHTADLSILRALGATEAPVAGAGSLDEPWFASYKKEMIKRFNARLKGQGVNDTSLEFEGLATKFAGPLTPLQHLSPASGTRFAAEALERTEARISAISLVHKTNSKMPRLSVPHPIIWFIQSSGLVATDCGPSKIELAVAPNLDVPTGLLPKADIPLNAAAELGLPAELGELTEAHWDEYLRSVASSDRPDELATLYALAAPFATAPAEMSALLQSGQHAANPVEIAVTTDASEIRILEHSGKPYLPCRSESDARLLIDNWNLKRAADLISSELKFTPSGPPQALADRFPLLGHLVQPDHRNVMLQDCVEITREVFTDTGRLSENLRFDLTAENVYRISGATDEELLGWINQQLTLGMAQADIASVIENADSKAAQMLMKKMRKAASDAERLLLAVPADELRQRIPAELLAAYEERHGAPNDVTIAELTLASEGYEALISLSAQLTSAGLTPPSRWAGGRRAIQFVTKELGFDRGYAGFADDRREENLDVYGPVPLPPLHTYQEKASGAMRTLIQAGGDSRGLLSLPTGAGKTRVAVQTLVSSMQDETLGSPVLWIAQSDELCEQAVESWAEVWQALGPAESLRISRLWSTNSAEAATEGHQVVIATIDKLNSACIGNTAFDWLKLATAVVIDEAHGSITPEYTKLLDWLEIKKGKTHAPLIGLSATPFRGVSETETKRLAGRYDNHRLDEAAFDEKPTVKLMQQQKILATVEHRVLEGSEIALTDGELAELKKLRMMPASVRERLGEDVDRNRTLVDSILSLDPDWPVLVFAASVSNAQTLAALLQHEGRASATISGQTKPSTRRYIVQQFKQGHIKVLTNYAVLTQGFDAPSIRALYVARPTYSPNLYQQMVGRGLRGPLNGGEPECLVVNVKDNLLRYNEELAFTEFEHLWQA
jgi:superfamily II DNA or RNA helicase